LTLKRLSADLALLLCLARQVRVGIASRAELAFIREHDVAAASSAFLSSNLHSALSNNQVTDCGPFVTSELATDVMGPQFGAAPGSARWMWRLNLQTPKSV
jgi:hypothetical protein